MYTKEERRLAKNVSSKKFRDSHIEEQRLYDRLRKKGYEGSYKGKWFRYNEKLPEGMVRHHQFYNDSNPNDGVVYMEIGKHIRLHALERCFMEIGGWKI